MRETRPLLARFDRALEDAILELDPRARSGSSMTPLMTFSGMKRSSCRRLISLIRFTKSAG